MTTSPFRTLVRASWQATTGERARFYGFVSLFIVATVLDLIIPWAFGYALEALTGGITDKTLHLAMMWVVVHMCLRLAKTIMHHFARYLQSTVAYSSRMYTLNNVFAAILKYPLNWHIESHSGDHLSKLHRSAGAVDGCIGTYIWQVIEGIVTLVFASLAIFALDFWVAVNVIATGFVIVIIMIVFNRRLTDRYRRNNSFYNKINRICIDYLFNVVTVKTLALEPAAIKYLHTQRTEGMVHSKKISKYSELKWGTTAVGYCLVTGTSLLIYLNGHAGTGQNFDVAKVYVLISYLDKIFQAIGSFTAYYGGLIEASTAYEDGAHILERAATVPPKEKSQVLLGSWKNIHIENLNFSYTHSDTSRVRDMQIDIKYGDKIALVGPSGGGKSTLLKILAGLLLPSSSHVTLEDGREIRISDVGSLSLLVPQEPEIFSETFRYNLTMGEHFSDEELKYFIGLGQLDSVLKKLPHSYETDLAEKGLNLSVGEKQRLAMVRGLLRATNRDMLLLDEPTSSLDPKTEKQIFLGLLSHFKDRVIITACHRLNLVPLFDKVVFIRDGAVEETGTFKELLAKGGAFSRAWEDYVKKVHKDGDDGSLSEFIL